MSQNLLSSESSPYLLQHKDNPIHWMPWGDAAFTRARAQDKPILLSAGYAACHWCHVMAHESFEDPAIAAIANTHFIAIKLDREERPDVDKLYMDALHALGEHGGWPLTMFLTPDGEPFWGGTYFPPSPRFGKPAFGHVLQEIARIWHMERHKVTANAQALTAALRRSAPHQAAPELGADDITAAGEVMLRAVDHRFGGLQGAPKFPQAAIFKFLFDQAIRTGRTDFLGAVETTLGQICQGGIYDHLAGGISRYSVDGRWLVPHFEKMLYDNAEFIGLLSRLWTATREPVFRTRLEQTVAFLLSAMRLPSGAFAASYDADSEGEEGTYYLWSEAEIDLALGTDARAFKTAYGVTPDGNFEHRTILNRLHADHRRTIPEEALFDTQRSRLIELRKRRIPPGFDDKVIASWNGLVIAGLAEAAWTTGRSDWLEAAKASFSSVCGLLWRDDTLWQSARGDAVRHHATIDGYAELGTAGLLLHALTGHPSFLSRTLELVDSAIRDFWNDEIDCFAFASRHATELIARQHFSADDATPNGNAVMALLLQRLGRMFPDSPYSGYAHRIIDRFSGAAREQPLAHAGMLAAAAQRADPIEPVITGHGTAEALALQAELVRHLGPGFPPLPIGSIAALPANHPAMAKAKLPGAALYLCRGMTCAAPAETPDQVGDALTLLGLPKRT